MGVENEEIGPVDVFDINFYEFEGAPENCRFQCTVTCTLRAARSAVPVCNNFGNFNLCKLSRASRSAVSNPN